MDILLFESFNILQESEKLSESASNILKEIDDKLLVEKGLGDSIKKKLMVLRDKIDLLLKKKTNGLKDDELNKHNDELKITADEAHKILRNLFKNGD